MPPLAGESESRLAPHSLAPLDSEGHSALYSHICVSSRSANLYICQVGRSLIAECATPGPETTFDFANATAPPSCGSGKEKEASQILAAPQGGCGFGSMALSSGCLSGFSASCAQINGFCGSTACWLCKDRRFLCLRFLRVAWIQLCSKTSVWVSSGLLGASSFLDRWRRVCVNLFCVKL